MGNNNGTNEAVLMGQTINPITLPILGLYCQIAILRRFEVLQSGSNCVKYDKILLQKLSLAFQRLKTA